MLLPKRTRMPAWIIRPGDGVIAFVNSMGGTPLSELQLTATADIPGSFNYLPPAGTILNAGDEQPISVIFTPTDAVNFNAVTTSVPLTITPVALLVTANPTNRAYGDTNPIFTATITGFVNGDDVMSTAGARPLAFVATGLGAASAGGLSYAAYATYDANELLLLGGLLGWARWFAIAGAVAGLAGFGVLALALRARMRRTLPIGVLAGLVISGVSAAALAAWDSGYNGAWIASALLTAQVLLVYSLTVVAHIGLMGRRFSHNTREWWSRLGGWVLIAAAVWVGVFGIVFLAPVVFAWAPGAWSSAVSRRASAAPRVHRRRRIPSELPPYANRGPAAANRIAPAFANI